MLVTEKEDAAAGGRDHRIRKDSSYKSMGSWRGPKQAGTLSPQVPVPLTAFTAPFPASVFASSLSEKKHQPGQAQNNPRSGGKGKEERLLGSFSTCSFLRDYQI